MLNHLMLLSRKSNLFSVITKPLHKAYLFAFGNCPQQTDTQSKLQYTTWKNTNTIME
jgi:hypothetical protein